MNNKEVPNRKISGWAIPFGLIPMLRCNWCAGKGKVSYRVEAGRLSTETVCKQCCGQGVLPIPYCEIGLPDYWGAL